MIMYGTHRCKDCEQAQRVLRENHIEYEYRDIHAKLSHLKEFLALRDRQALFAQVKEEERIGVPCFYWPESGRVELDIEKVVKGA